MSSNPAQFVSDLRQVRWFSQSNPVSSTNKTESHDITEILLKAALNTITIRSTQNTFISKRNMQGTCQLLVLTNGTVVSDKNNSKICSPSELMINLPCNGGYICSPMDTRNTFCKELFNNYYYYTSVYIFYIKLNGDKITILHIKIQLLILFKQF